MDDYFTNSTNACNAFKDRDTDWIRERPEAVAAYLGLRTTIKGRETWWCCPNPDHDDRNPSCHRVPNSAACKCMSCGWSGDALTMIAVKRGLDVRVDFSQVKAIGLEAIGAASSSTSTRPPRPKRVEPRAVMPALDDAGEPPKPKLDGGGKRLAARYVYRNVEGAVLYYRDRIEGAGGKRFLPWTYRGGMWTTKAPDAGERPLYGLERIKQNAGAKFVLVVEGEKTADAGNMLDVLRGVPVVTSAEGAGGVKHHDWSPLRGLHVVVLPDADAAGAKYAAEVARALHDIAASVRLVELPPRLTKGWDIADDLPPGVTSRDVREWIDDASSPGDDDAPPNGERAKVKAAFRRARLVCVADVPPEPIDWLWWPRLARGKHTLLAGDPGAGKTYLALAIAARLSRGESLPGDSERREPCDVVYMTREDGIADTIRPRLDALGADASRVHVLAGAMDGGSVSLADIDLIQNAIADTRAGLVVIDPVQSWIGAGVDAHRANETRPLLDGLATVLEAQRCASLVIAHMPKATVARVVTAALGSIDFVAASRVMLVAGTDPHDKEVRVLAGGKSNIGPLPESIAYTLDGSTGLFAWGGVLNLSAAEMLAAEAASPDARDAINDAREWLREELAAGPRPAKEMQRAARAADIAASTLGRARRLEGVESRRRGFGPGGEWVWEHPIGTIESQDESVGAYDAYGAAEQQPRRG